MIFLNSASFAPAQVFYLAGLCTHTATEGKQRKAGVRNILKSSEKNTIFNEHPVQSLMKYFPDLTQRLWIKNLYRVSQKSFPAHYYSAVLRWVKEDGMYT